MSAEMAAKFLFDPFFPFLRHYRRYISRYYSIRSNNEANGL